MKVQTTIRVEKDIFIQTKEILNDLGLNYSQAINIFNSMVTKYKGLPFEVKLPNEKTRKVISEAREGINVDDFSLNELK